MDIKVVGVIGAGQMGAGIAQIVAANGYTVILNDIKEELCAKAVSGIKQMLDKRVAQGKELQENVDKIMENISFTENMQELSKCDLVVEAIPENLALKQELFASLGRICRKDTLLCTNTSSLSITDIMSQCSNQERCVGMHFFFPVVIMRLVEIIRTSSTSNATVEKIKAFSADLGKTAVLCKTDTPGFIVNRCLFAFMLEAISCYRDGVASIEDIDTAMKMGLNHPLGPFEMMDLSGLDTFPHVCESLESLPVTDWSTPSSVLELVNDGKFGRKNGQGWYNY